MHTEPYQALILGAGLAGLAAGSVFRDHDIKFLILEARDRVGGRLWTVGTNGTTLELGAQVLHSPSQNPLSSLAKKIGLKTVQTFYGNYELFRDKLPIPEMEVERFKKMFSGVMKKAVSRWHSPNVSVKEALEKEGLEKTFSDYPDLKNWFLESAAIFSGEELERLSVRFFEDAEEYDAPALFVPGGLTQLMEEFKKKLSPENLKTSQPVQKIEWKNDTLRVFSGKDVFTAAKLLVTLPLGVLKSGHVRFAPALPKRKQQAINRLGFGTLDLAYLEFPRVFWPVEHDFIGITKEVPFPRFFNYQKFKGIPALGASFAADAARELENKSDEEIVARAMATLKKVFRPDIPEPIKTKITRWSHDPYAMGSYSNLAVGASPFDRKALAKPIRNKIFFAGEATDEKDPGTLHGAFLSGIREAYRMVSSRTIL